MTTTNPLADGGEWYRSSYSSGGDNCVDVATTTDGSQILVRDSKAPADPPCVIGAVGWDGLLADVISSRPPGQLPSPRRLGAPMRDKMAVRFDLDLAATAWRPAGPQAHYAFLGHPAGPIYVALRQDTVVLVFTMPEWDAFVAGARDGEFAVDRLLLAQVQDDATRAAAVAARTGQLADEFIAGRRAEAVAELRYRH
jgi:hypothetical protein